MAYRINFPEPKKNQDPDEIPPSPSGYTGVLVGVYFYNLNPKSKALGVFLNKQSGHVYHYRIKDFNAFDYLIGDLYYVSVEILGSGEEKLISAVPVRKHDNQRVKTKKVELDFS